MILPGEGVHARKMVDTLIRLHPVQFINLNTAICPQYVPLVIWIRIVCHVGCSRQSHFEHRLSDIPNHVVLGLRDIEDKSFCFKSSLLLCCFICLHSSRTTLSNRLLAFFCRSYCCLNRWLIGLCAILFIRDVRQFGHLQTRYNLYALTLHISAIDGAYLRGFLSFEGPYFSFGCIRANRHTTSMNNRSQIDLRLVWNLRISLNFMLFLAILVRRRWLINVVVFFYQHASVSLWSWLRKVL